MKCPKCQTDLPDGAKFCLECGQELTVKDQPSNSSPLPEAQRKRVTALFSDLSGYTAITEKLDPEEVKEITSRIFDGVKAIISKYEGIIERIAGDGLLALFGVPKAHEDDPIRAIHAAREIHSLVDDVSPQYEAKINRALCMHSGVNTGLAVTSDMDLEKGFYGVTGDAINIAARLSDLAKPNEILIGPETHKLSQTRFSFEPLNPTQVKGKTKLIRIYKLRSTKTHISSVKQSRQVSSEMVGRDQDLDKLELQVMKAINGEGSVVNVIGEAGIGKSRLIAELKKRDVLKRVTLLEGRAISIGKNLPFHPIIDLLKNWAEIAEDDSTTSAFKRLEKAIRAIHPEETDEILPFVATLMGMKFTGRHAKRIKGIEGEALEKLIVKNVRDLVIKGSELRPTVFVMEDLHWADTSSIELLDALYRLAEKHKLVFINVYRPGYLDEKDQGISAFGKRLPAYSVEIEIQPLERDDSEKLIENMLEIKGLPFSIRDQIVNRAGGNPFFIEEVGRSLIDEGAIVKKKFGFEVTDKINGVVIPPTINDVLIARIDRLEEQTRELVKVASVIGRSFFDRIIKDVADFIAGVDDRLIYLKDAQLIRDRIRMQEVEYLFKHALAQEAAYDSTLIQQRKALHLKVAQSIERIFRERLHEFFGMLAYHFSKGGDLDKAEEYMVKAGEEALRSSASSEALNYFQDALKLYEERYSNEADLEKLSSFKKNLALAHFYRGHFGDALLYINEILMNKGYQPSRNTLLSAIKFVLEFLIISIRLYSPIRLKTRVPDLGELKDCNLIAMKLTCLAAIDFKRMEFEGVSWVRRFLDFDLPAIPQGLTWLSLNATGLIVGGYLPLGSRMIKYLNDITKNQDTTLEYALPQTFLVMHEGSWSTIPVLNFSILDKALDKGEFWSSTIYLLVIGQIRLEQGRFEDSKIMADKLQEIGENYGYVRSRFLGKYLKAAIFIKTLSLRQALSEAEKGVVLSEQTGEKNTTIALLGHKAIAGTLVGQIDIAQTSLRKGELVISELRKIQVFWLTPFLLGQFITHLHLLKDAIGRDHHSQIQQQRKTIHRIAAQVLKVSKKIALYRTWIFRLVGEYYWLIGKQKKAIKWWNRSIKEGVRLGARPDLSRTYFEVGKWLLEPESKYKQLNGIDSKDYLENARTMFEEMGLERDLDQLDRIGA